MTTAATAPPHRPPGGEGGSGSSVVSCQVAIVGAGAAGLRCAHRLVELGVPPEEIVVVEARDRVGGRVHTTTERRVPWGRRRSSRRRSAGASAASAALDGEDESSANDEVAAPVEFAMDHGAAWVHGTSVPWGWSGFDDEDGGDPAAVPFLNPMMELLLDQHGSASLYGELGDENDGSGGSRRAAPAVLNPVFEGNPWTRPRAVLRGKLVLYRGGARVPAELADRALDRHFELMRRVSDIGNGLYRRGEGMEAARQSLGRALDRAAAEMSEEGGSRGGSGDASAVRAVAGFFVHLIECWNGAGADRLQLAEFVRDDGDHDGEDSAGDDSRYREDGSFSGPHCTVAPGMRTVLEPLLRDGVRGRVMLGQPVSSIRDDPVSGRVVVRTEAGLTVRARACVNTMPAGVLSEAVRSGLLDGVSAEKRRALDSAQMGCYKKVFLTFDRIFWPPGAPFLGLVRSGEADAAGEPTSPLGGHLLIDNLWACRDVPCLEAVLFGPAGEWATGRSDEDIRDAVLEFLRDAVGIRAMDGANCVGVHVTRWEEDPYSRGAYSSVAVGASIRHVQELNRPEWGGRLVLAGEACVGEFEGSVHSALMSGRDAADAVHEFLLSSGRNTEGDRELPAGESEEPGRLAMLV